MKNRGFSLLELLVVVFVIGVLASIAVPNFLQAQVKAKVARSLGDLKTIAEGIEFYRTDYSTVPRTDGPFAPSYFERLRPLTTPIAYLTELPTDPFQPMQQPFMFSESEAHLWQNRMYAYNRGDAENGASQGQKKQTFGFTWSVTATGPDRRIHYPYYFFPHGFIMPEWYIYNPSNGTISGGEIFYRSVNSKSK